MIKTRCNRLVLKVTALTFLVGGALSATYGALYLLLVWMVCAVIVIGTRCPNCGTLTSKTTSGTYSFLSPKHCSKCGYEYI